LLSAVSWVQNIGAAANNFGDLHIQVNKAVSAGHSVLVEVAGSGTAPSTVTVTDTANNHYTRDLERDTNANSWVEIWSAHGVHALPAGGFINAHLTAAPGIEVAGASEFEGLDAQQPVDTSRGEQGTSTSPASNWFKTNGSNDLVFAAFGTWHNPFDLLTASHAYTPGPARYHNQGPAWAGLVTEYKVNAPPAWYNPSGTLASSAEWSAVAVAYQADTATHFGLTPSTGDTPVGQAFNLTVTALDGQGNVAGGYTGTVHFSSSDSQAGLPADYTFTAADHGTHTFTVSLSTPGAQSITAADVRGGTSQVASGTAAVNAFLNDPAPAAPVNITPEVTVSVIKQMRLKHGRLKQILNLHYSGAAPVGGPVWLVLDNLNRHARLRHSPGVTQVLPPLGSPYIQVVPDNFVWDPGQGVNVTLEFVARHGKSPSYTPRVVDGFGAL
jgi:hypothetical protein